jgi:hypothetical protein
MKIKNKNTGKRNQQKIAKIPKIKIKISKIKPNKIKKVLANAPTTLEI